MRASKEELSDKIEDLNLQLRVVILYRNLKAKKVNMKIKGYQYSIEYRTWRKWVNEVFKIENQIANLRFNTEEVMSLVKKLIPEQSKVITTGYTQYDEYTPGYSIISNGQIILRGQKYSCKIHELKTLLEEEKFIVEKVEDCFFNNGMGLTSSLIYREVVPFELYDDRREIFL